MVLKTYPLRFGLVAEIVTSDDDRLPYVPPPAPPTDPAQHVAQCPCPKCALQRTLGARGAR